jgi:hypothetical protein
MSASLCSRGFRLFAALAVLASPPSKVVALPEWNLAAEPTAAARAGNENATGLLPPGWWDDSAWADLKVRYTPSEFEGTRFYRVEIDEIRTGQVQIATHFPTDLPPGPVRISFQARSSRPISVSLGVRDAGPPFRTWWSEQTRVGGMFTTEEFEFDPGPLPLPAFFLISINTPATVDLGAISFEKGTVEAESPESPNLLRNSRFPLGLQATMSIHREFSDGEHFTIEPDYRPEGVGPSGAPAMRIRSEREFHWDGELFRVWNRQERHTASIYVKGEGSLKLTAMERNVPIAERSFTIRPEESWRRVEIPFQPVANGQNHFIRFSSSGEIWLDGAMVNEGDSAMPFAGMKEAEVALAVVPGKISIAGMQFDDEPAVMRYMVTGNIPENSRLEALVTDAAGQTAAIGPIDLTRRDSWYAGEFLFDRIPGQNLGAFRIEARAVDASGRPISPWAEAVVSRVMPPRHWGRLAPDSPFGIHLRPAARHLLMAKATGNNWARLHNDGNHITSWALIEPDQGQWRWADDDLQRYRDHHFEILGMLETAPKWASLWGLTERGKASGRPGYFEMFFQPRTPSLYADYVSTVAQRYRDQIRAWEVWNEPWQIKWFGADYVEDEGRQKIVTSENPQRDYVALMRAAFEAVKAIDPELTVVGFNSTSNEDHRPVPEGVFGGSQWTAGVLAENGERYTDAASFHYYTGEMNAFPGDQAERAVRTAFGPNELIPERVSLPIWMTEGSSTVGGRIRHGLYRHSLPYRNGEDPLHLTELVLRYDVALLARGISKIFLYAMGDFAQGTPGSYRTFVTSSGSLHPSALGRATLAWHVDGLEFRRGVELGDGVYAFVFEGQGRSVAVICPRFGHGTLLLPTNGDIVVRDLFNNPRAADETIGDQSVFVTLEGPAEDLLSILRSSRHTGSAAPAAGAIPVPATTELVKNSAFDDVTDGGFPADWANISHPTHLASVGVELTVETEGPSSFYRIQKTNSSNAGAGEQRVVLPASAKQVRLALCARSPGFEVGGEDWQRPGLSLSWLTDSGERPIGPGQWLLLREPSESWKTLDRTLDRPADAAGIKIVFNAIGWTGTADFESVVVEPID